MPDKDSFRAVLQSLVDAYLQHEPEYTNNREYNEFTLRREFLDAFFEALGWDIGNKSRKPPKDREIRFERPNEKRKRPDYLFLIDRVPKFIVEAKAPAESLDHALTVNQAKSYAWNTADASIAVLTNFGDFRIYDGSIRPDPQHPERGLLKRLNCREYLSNIDFLWNFSRDEVASDSLDKLLPKGPKARQYRVPVDEAFLDDMTRWREDLAKDLYKRNPRIPVGLLNEVVQRILDRLVFIRMAEDRGILPDKGLLEISQTWRQQNPNRPIQNFINDLFDRVRQDLNGEIFAPHACEDSEYWFSPGLLAGIIEHLYFPKSPYLFDVIGIELLGNIYERFLGKTIRLTEKRVHVEDKPEVRKAGGVYYTPRPIVSYIVETVIGERIRDKPPDQLASFRVLDPACGSGSFLVAAFSRIIEEYTNYYTNHPIEAKRGTIYPDLIPEGDVGRLSIEKKAEILRACIFGVDVDPQAVEVTMMSLYLKVLEGEQSLPQNKALLPRLRENIRCGNSLVGRDSLAQTTLDGLREGRGLNPFEWGDGQEGFGRILEGGGFDAVIGNPPYIRIQQLREFAPQQADYVREKYASARSGNIDLYIPFIEKATQVVAPTGEIGYIVSHKFFKTRYGRNIREIITTRRMLAEVVNFGSCQVFKLKGRRKGPTTYTCMLFLSPVVSDSIRYSEFRKISNLDRQLSALSASSSVTEGDFILGQVEPLPAGGDPWNLTLSPGVVRLLRRLQSKWPSLLRVANRIFQGNKTGDDAVYILEVVASGARLTKVKRADTGEVVSLENEILKPIVGSEDMHRYDLTPPSRVLLFPYKIQDGKGVLLDAHTLQHSFPHAWEYLNSNRARLEERKGPRKWWAYSAPKSLARFEHRKIVTPDLAPSAWYCYDSTGKWHFPGGVSGGYGILLPDDIEPLYVLGLLNSRLLSRLLKSISTKMRGDWYSFEHLYIKELPIRLVDSADSEGSKVRDEIVSRVQQLQILYPRFHHLPESSERDALNRQIVGLESEVDERVERLYELTPEDKTLL